jgi:hypothetical protein
MTEISIRRSLYAGIGVVLVLLLVGLFLRLRSELRMRHFRELQQALRNAPPEQRAAKFEELRDTMRSISQRDRERMMADGRKRFEREMIRYTKLSKDEKQKYLDERIDRSQRFSSPGGGPPPNFTGGRNRNMSAEERDRRRKERLDQTSPEFRAAMDQFRRDMENRRRQRGGK